MMNFVMHVVDGTRFKQNRRINELFGLSRDSKPSMDMTAQRMVNWASRILKTFSLEVKLDKKTNDIHLSHLGDIVEVIRRKNANGRYYEDEGNLLNLKRRPARREIDTSGLDVDVFIDDDGEVPAVEPPVQSQMPQEQAVRSEPGYHGNLDLNIDEDEAADEPMVKQEPQVRERQQQAAIKLKKVRSSRFIPDFDW